MNHRNGRIRHSSRQTIQALALLALSLLPFSVSAIPVQIQEHNLSLTLPEGFEEMAPLTNDPDVVRLFVRRASPAEEPNTWLSIRRLPPSATKSNDWAPTNTGGSLLGRYGERMRDLDVADLQTRLMTNDTVIIESQAPLPMGSVPLQLDIRSRAMEDLEMKKLMRTILASAAAQPEDRRDTSHNGSGAMFLCLVLGAALIVIACGRR